jgi:uncharacterized protein YkwD
MIRLGPERTAIPYDDPRAAEKAALLARINRDRALNGRTSLRYEPRAALVGDLFCLDSALSGVLGHWDLQGRGPHLRWALAGGADFHVENAAGFTYSSGTLERTLVDLMIESHQAMMDERPPADGHRRTILDPELTHVGIGVAAVAGQFRMTQEFTRVSLDWMEVPEGPLRAGGVAAFAGKPLPGWEVGAVEVRFETPPRPLSLREAAARRTYGYPPVVRTLRPRLPSGVSYPDGHRGELRVKPGERVFVAFPLDQGPGHYFVLCYMRMAGSLHEPLRPGSAAMITALP